MDIIKKIAIVLAVFALSFLSYNFFIADDTSLSSANSNSENNSEVENTDKDNESDGSDTDSETEEDVTNKGQSDSENGDDKTSTNSSKNPNKGNNSSSSSKNDSDKDSESTTNNGKDDSSSENSGSNKPGTSNSSGTSTDGNNSGTDNEAGNDNEEDKTSESEKEVYSKFESPSEDIKITTVSNTEIKVEGKIENSDDNNIYYDFIIKAPTSYSTDTLKNAYVKIDGYNVNGLKIEIGSNGIPFCKISRNLRKPKSSVPVVVYWGTGKEITYTFNFDLEIIES